MQTVSEVLRAADRITRENSPAILTAMAATGTVATAVLAGKASFEAGQYLGWQEQLDGVEDEAMPRFKRRLKLVWRSYIPAVTTGTLTLACIYGAAKVNSRRTAALTMAYSLSDRAFHEYRDKVTETFGEGKEQKVRDEVAQDRVASNPPGEVILMGSGQVLCCELYTGRYFNGDIDAIRKAENEVNSKINRHGSACLSDFYELIGLPFTSNSWEMGWQDTKLLALEITSLISEDGRPCLAFNYKDIVTL